MTSVRYLSAELGVGFSTPAAFPEVRVLGQTLEKLHGARFLWTLLKRSELLEHEVQHPGFDPTVSSDILDHLTELKAKKKISIPYPCSCLLT